MQQEQQLNPAKLSLLEDSIDCEYNLEDSLVDLHSIDVTQACRSKKEVVSSSIDFQVIVCFYSTL